jgi:hypothetical protein
VCGFHQIGNWKNALEDFDDPVSDVVAGVGFGVGRASQAVISILIEGGPALAELVAGKWKDFEAELPFQTNR